MLHCQQFPGPSTSASVRRVGWLLQPYTSAAPRQGSYDSNTLSWGTHSQAMSLTAASTVGTAGASTQPENTPTKSSATKRRTLGAERRTRRRVRLIGKLAEQSQSLASASLKRQPPSEALQAASRVLVDAAVKTSACQCGWSTKLQSCDRATILTAAFRASVDES